MVNVLIILITAIISVMSGTTLCGYRMSIYSEEVSYSFRPGLLNGLIRRTANRSLTAGGGS